MKRYRISDFSRRSGISCDTLRYYEKLGLITAQRQYGNAYRTYDDYDLIMSSQLRMMRSIDMPLSLLAPEENPHTLDAIEQHLHTEEQMLTRQLEALHSKLRRVRMLQREFDESRQLAGICREADYPETLNLILPDDAPDTEYAAVIAAWQSKQPYVHLNCFLNESPLTFPEDKPMNARLAFGVLASYAEEFSLPMVPGIIRRPASAGIRCILKVRDPLHPAPHEFLPLIQYLDATGRTTTGPWQYRIRFIDQQPDGTQICYIAMRVNVCPAK